MNRGRLTCEERSKIDALAAAGNSVGRIAQRLDRHASTVGYYMTVHGLRAPTPRTFSYMRNGCLVTSFSQEEDALISAMRTEEKTVTTIAEVCGSQFGHRRSPNSIAVRLKYLASKAETEEPA